LTFVKILVLGWVAATCSAFQPAARFKHRALGSSLSRVSSRHDVPLYAEEEKNQEVMDLDLEQMFELFDEAAPEEATRPKPGARGIPGDEVAAQRKQQSEFITEGKVPKPPPQAMMAIGAWAVIGALWAGSELLRS